MNYLIVHPDNKEKLTAVKAVLKALKVDFDEADKDFRPVSKRKTAASEITNAAILQSIEAYENGKISPTPLSLDDLKEMIDA